MPKLLLIGCAVALIAACGGPAAGPDSPAPRDEGSVFHRGNGGEPDTLDPHRSEETSGHAVLRDAFEGLVTEAVDSSLEPGVAASWTLSEDGRTYSFALRPDARWSDGAKVVAQDFVAGLRRTVDPRTASTYAQVLYPIRNAAAITRGGLPVDALGVRAIDDATLVIELEAPTAYFLQLLTHASTYPLHRPSFQEHGDLFARPGNLVSNGPYRVTEWVVNSHIRLEKNEFYRAADEVDIDVVYFHSTEDVDAELRRYRAGELDYTMQIPNSQYAWIRENLGDEIHVQPYLNVYFYGLDVTEPPLDDVRVRQALSMAIDREIITAAVTGVGEVPAYGLVPSGVASYEPVSYAWRDLPQEERIAAARELYQAAGYSADNPLQLELRYNTSENHERIAIAIAAMWKQNLGVEATILNEEWKVLLQTRLNPARWDALRYSWSGDYNDAFTFLEIFQTGHGQNFTGFSSAAYDALTRQAAGEADLAARAATLAEAELALLEEYAFIPLYFYVSKHLVKPHVRGYEANIMNHNMSRHYRIQR